MYYRNDRKNRNGKAGRTRVNVDATIEMKAEVRQVLLHSQLTSFNTYKMLCYSLDWLLQNQSRKLGNSRCLPGAIAKSHHRSDVFLHGQRSTQSNVDSSITNSLDQANVTLSNLHALCKRLKVSTSGSLTTVDLNWKTWIREQSKVKKVKRDLKSVTMQLMTALGALNAYVTVLFYEESRCS